MKKKFTNWMHQGTMLKHYIILLASIFSVSIVQSQKPLETISRNSNTLFSSCLLPVPQKMSLSAKTFLLQNDWRVDSVDEENERAYECLLKGLQEKIKGFQKTSANKTESVSHHRIHFRVKEGLVNIEATTDTNRTEILKQAYRLILHDTTITIEANASQGLFYGTQTLLQLIKHQYDEVLLPEGEIVDWPDMNVRMIYWDDAHHLEKMEALKEVIRQAAYYKINAFAIKLEGHFEYKTASAVVEPYAMSPEEYQELTDYARSYFIDLVPYLDAPGHVSFILKHPEYAHLRAFPNSNYEFSVLNHGTDSIILHMFDELISANKGGKYILLSTDEAYYVGKARDDQKQAEALGSRGKLLAQFITRIANELHKKGRKVIFWGEYPLTPSDIPALPSHLIDGVYDSATASLYKQNGMRQFIYTYTQGEEPLFPSYYPMSSADSLSDINKDRARGRVEGILQTITSAIAQKKSDFMGVIVAGWADAGLHPETFWLGYASGAAAGWKNKDVSARDSKERFYNSFYGQGTIEMDSVYRLLSRQAQFYDESWDWKDSDLRSPIFGNHAEIYKTPKPARDQTLPELPVPSGNNLFLSSDWIKMNKERLQSAKQFLKENDQLTLLLHKNLRSVSYNRYNLEVMLSVAQLCKQNLKMLLHLEHIDSLLKLASRVDNKDAIVAVSLLDDALTEAETIKTERNETLLSLISVWYKTWFPREEIANGRRYVNIVDDVKDHRPVRTIDMTYLIYRELHFPLGEWAKKLENARNNFAEKNGLSTTKKQLLREEVN